MIALILALALTQGTPAPTADTLAPTAQSTPAPVTAAPDPPDPADQLRALQTVFDQSCGQKAYGSYDDLCSSLTDQIRAYRREAERTRRTPPPARDGKAAAPAGAPG